MDVVTPPFVSAPTIASRRSTLFVSLVLVTLGLALRLPGLSRGSLYRDDAWVALTRRVPLGTAWHMVGSAPLFTLAVRAWTQLTEPSTLLAQMPILMVALIGIAALTWLARLWGLPTWAIALTGGIVAVGSVDVAYATHVKPYAHDILASCLVLATSWWWRRGHSLWWFVAVGLLCASTSLTTVPLFAGVGVVVVAMALRNGRLRSVVVPGVTAALSMALLWWFVRGGLSPQLRQSWEPNFLNLTSVGGFVRSLESITRGLLGSLFETTPHVHLAGLGTAIFLVALLGIALGVTRGGDYALAGGGLLGAFVACACHVAPLGTGRTDAYLHPAMALLFAGGLVRLASWRRHVFVQRSVILGAVALVVLTTFDRYLSPPSYPGGSIAPVVAQATETVRQGGAVLIEGTARWPWSYYVTPRVRIGFSPQYNTGFFPRNTQPHVYVMPGTTIEGGYNATRAVAALRQASPVTYVRTDDWPAMGNPLAPALAADCYRVMSERHVPGYIVEQLQRCKPVATSP